MGEVLKSLFYIHIRAHFWTKNALRKTAARLAQSWFLATTVFHRFLKHEMLKSVYFLSVFIIFSIIRCSNLYMSLGNS